MNRRRFFKKAAKGLLPMLGAIVVGPSVVIDTLTSCSKDAGCDGCEAACMDDCQTTCSGSCVGAASGSTPVQTYKGSGTLSDPYYASDAVKFVKTLREDEPTTESYYIKGKVSKIYTNYDNGVGWAYFNMSDDGKDKNTLTAEVYYFNNQDYVSGPLLKVGDDVVINGNLEYDVGIIPFCHPGYLYSLNGQTSGGSGTCRDCATACSGACTTSCSTTCKGSSTSSTCSNCASDCSSGCSTGCSTTCKGSSSSSSCTGCGSGCSSSCGSGCSTGCSTGCSGSCGTGCGTGCQGKCDTSCTTGCGAYCKQTCGGSCDGTCANTCSTQCVSSSKAGCSGTCFGKCSSTCAKTCSSYCYSSCKNVGRS